MNILVTICARGGSKGIPGKNIRQVAGKPLIAYTIDVAKRFQEKYEQANIVLSTDSDQIKHVASLYGLDSDYKRSQELSGDTMGKIEVIRDILFFYENKNMVSYDYVLDLDVTSPLRNLTDIENGFHILGNDPEAFNLFSVSPSSRNPYFNMVEKKFNGYYAQVKKIESDVFTRQGAPAVYDLNASFYLYRRIFFEKGFNGAITDRSLIYEMPHMCFDLDHPVDFDFMTYLLENNKLDFEL